MSALPSQRSTQHPPSIASPAPPCSGERKHQYASRLRIPTQEDIRENARKNAVSCKTVGHGTVNRQDSSSQHTTPTLNWPGKTCVSTERELKHNARQAQDICPFFKMRKDPAEAKPLSRSKKTLSRQRPKRQKPNAIKPAAS